MPPGHKTQVADRYHPESGSLEEGWRQRADALIRLCTAFPPIVATQTSPVSSPTNITFQISSHLLFSHFYWNSDDKLQVSHVFTLLGSVTLKFLHESPAGGDSRWAGSKIGCRIMHVNVSVEHKCAGSAAPRSSKLTPAKLSFPFKERHIHLIYFTSDLLPLQKPKSSLPKRRCSLWPHSKRLSLDLSVLSLPSWLVYIKLESRVKKWTDHKLKAEVWLPDWV